MYRCLQLARLGAGYVSPNPMVGSVLVHQDKIIGEGYHRQYGEPHAEVNCINSVPSELQHLIPQSTIYVSLEPCAHFGKTPPCADLIIRHKIPRVVVGVRDPFEAVNGKGIDKLQAAGIEVMQGVLEKECRELNQRFFTFHTQQRPYIILKWAQTADGFIAPQEQVGQSQRLLISNGFTKRLVHKWRSEEAAICIGTNTALQDDPSLNNRFWSGHNPTRVVVDKQLKLPKYLKLFNREIPTIIFNGVKDDSEENLRYFLLDTIKDLPSQICQALYQLNLQSVIIEGGTKLLQSFIDAGLYDEVRLIENTNLYIGKGIAAPHFPTHFLKEKTELQSDHISYFRKNIHP